MKHFLSISDQSSASLQSLIDRSFYFKQKNLFGKNLQNLYVALLFFENSTRTKFSFEVAAKNLGSHVLHFEPENSSLEKGESLLDTMKTLESLGTRIAVIRHSDDELIETIAKKVNLSLINAGAGKKEHPTQALLDIMTMVEEFGQTRRLKILIAGDILHSRVATSNFLLLNKLGHEVVFSGPKVLMPLYQHDYENFDLALKTSDVVMILRMQKERHDHNFTGNHYLEEYGLTLARAKQMKKDAIIMHPAPINWGMELEDGIAELASSRIFRQMQNGVYARMAVLESLVEAQ
ncbi:MAG: aspartate carbamoyltransferase catalytic subunit [Bacteriovoracaceae bacterium]